MSALKPCPFFGGKAKPTKYDQYDSVICSSCDASIYNECFTEEEVINEWNSRTPVLKWRSADEKPEENMVILAQYDNGTVVGTVEYGGFTRWFVNFGFSFDNVLYEREIIRWIPLSEVLAVIK